MKVSKLTLVTIMLFALVSCQDFNSIQYLKLSANAKMKHLWNEITENTHSGDWFGLHTITGLFGEDLHATFDHLGDVLPEGREKLIHSVGSIAKAKFIPTEDHPYTGILRSGCDNVLLRLSTGKPYDTKKTNPEAALFNFVPGLAIKFLIDGKPSTNTVAMHSTSGQNSWNFFENDFTPQFDINYDMSFAEKLVAAKFTEISYYISTLGNREMCSIDQDGTEVSKGEDRFPFKLIFRAPNKIKKTMSQKFTEDYTKVVAEFPKDTIIFEVYALDDFDCEENYIGEIKLTSRFTTSEFADTKLFFKHPSNEPDFEVYPSWKNHRDYWSVTEKEPAKEVKKRQGCPFEELWNGWK
jgi:hypothetical protein